MSTRLIRMADGIVVQIEADDSEEKQISAKGKRVEEVSSRFDCALPTIRTICQSFASLWRELDKEVSIDEVNIELALGFEAGGTVFLASGKSKVNLAVTVTMKPTG